MAVKSQTVDGRPERLVVIACCTNKVVVAQLAPKWTPSALPSRWANLVVGWCVEHFKQYGDAPKTALGAKFDLWREKCAEPNEVEIVGRFLSDLSDQHARTAEDLAPDFALDVAAKLMRRVQLVETIAKAQANLESGELEKAVEEIQAFKPVDVSSQGWIETADTENILALMAKSRENREVPLIKYEGGAANMLGVVMRRSGFVAFAGYEKGNKSFWLQDTACRAFEQGRQVAYFEGGDSSREEVLDRLAVRLARWPLVPDTTNPVRIPSLLEGPASKGGNYNIDYTRKHFRKGLSDALAAEALKGGEGAGRMRLTAHPTGTLSVPMIESQIEEWRNEGWMPDCAIIDYADLLAPVNQRADPRDQINQNWQMLRALSLKYKILLVTATQVKRDAYDAPVIKRIHMADDKRKLAWVTALIGINRRPKEVEDQIWRLNVVVGRGVKLSDEMCLYTAGCLDIGNPCILSTF